MIKIKNLYNSCKLLTKKYLSLVWNVDTKKFAGKDLYDKVKSNETSRIKQLCCKKAIDIKRSIMVKITRRGYIIEKLKKENKKSKNRLFIDTNKNHIIKLQQTIDKLNKKPIITRFSLDLNANIVKIEQNSPKTKFYKNWINISSTTHYNVKIPFLKTKIFNKWNKIGKLSNFISIDEKGLIRVVFSFTKKIKKKGIEVGCDIGLTNVYSFNNKIISQPNSHNFDLPKIHQKICKTIVGSIGCRKARTHRDNYIRESINNINFGKIKTLVVEDIKYLRCKKSSSRYLKSWRYCLILQKLTSMCEELGITLIQVNPCNTSRRCFKCGWVSEKNRSKLNAKLFRCQKCKCKDDADINAAKNILFIKKRKHIKNKNSLVTEFYFN